MADITRLSRFVGGLPRDIDITTNTLHVDSLKVGTSTPASLTQAMTVLLDTITNGAGLPAANLSAAAKQSTLESKLAALRVGVLGFSPTTGNTSDIADSVTLATLTSVIYGAATTDTPVGGDAKEGGILQVSNYALLSGATVTVDGITVTEGVDWTAATSDSATALSLANALTSAVASCSFVQAGQNINVLRTTVGVYNTAWATSDVVNLVVNDKEGNPQTQPGATLTGGAVATGVGGLTAKGVFVGTVSGSADIGKVLIRVNGTDNGFDDGTGDEIYGVLSEAAGVYTLSYKTAAGTPYTILSPDTASKFDFYFIEVMDLYSFGVDRLLMPAIGGVVDATTASSVYAESTARSQADVTLQLNIDAEASARSDADCSLQTELDLTQGKIGAAIDGSGAWLGFSGTNYLDAELTITNSLIVLDTTLYSESTTRADADITLQLNIDAEASARSDADVTLQLNIDAEASARSDADITLQANIDDEASARSDADITLQANIDAEASARSDADITLQANIDAEATARAAADSSLQTELDLTQGKLGAAIDGDGAWLGFSGTTYLDAELTFTAAFEVLDAQLASIVTSSVDVSFVAATGGVTAGDVVALGTVAGEVIKANANGIATCESVVGVALETKTVGQAVLVRTLGEATVTTDGTNFDIGKRVYSAANATSGLATKTAPSTANNVVHLVGGATATNKVFVNTNLEYVVT